MLSCLATSMRDQPTESGDHEYTSNKNNLIVSRAMPIGDRMNPADLKQFASTLHSIASGSKNSVSDDTAVKQLDINPHKWFEDKRPFLLLFIFVPIFLFFFSTADTLVGKISAGITTLILIPWLPVSLGVTWLSSLLHRRNSREKDRAFTQMIEYSADGVTPTRVTSPPAHVEPTGQQRVDDPGEYQQQLNMFNGPASQAEGVYRTPLELLSPDETAIDPRTEIQVRELTIQQEATAGRFEQGSGRINHAGPDNTLSKQTILDSLVLAGSSYDAQVPLLLCIKFSPYRFGGVDTESLAEYRQENGSNHPLDIKEIFTYGSSSSTDGNQLSDTRSNTQALRDTDGRRLFESNIFLISSARGTTQDTLADNIKNKLDSQSTTTNVEVKEKKTVTTAGSDRIREIFDQSTFNREPPSRSLAKASSGVVWKFIRTILPRFIPLPPVHDHSRTNICDPSEVASHLTLTDSEAVHQQLADRGHRVPVLGDDSAEVVGSDDPFTRDTIHQEQTMDADSTSRLFNSEAETNNGE